MNCEYFSFEVDNEFPPTFILCAVGFALLGESEIEIEACFMSLLTDVLNWSNWISGPTNCIMLEGVPSMAPRGCRVRK
jgi:hypothetical protein